jgi:glutathione S-transferase
LWCGFGSGYFVKLASRILNLLNTLGQKDMIKLHGATISNYYNTAKLALVEKQIAFEEVAIFPSQKPEVLENSPVGKVPWIEVDGNVLSETNVIFDYLEEIKPNPSLYPSDPFARAKVRELVRVVELYLDAPARRHIASVYFGAPVNPVVFDEARPEIEKGIAALKQFAKFAPYIAGDEFTFADVSAYFQLRFVNLHTTKIYDWNINDSVPGLAEYFDLVGSRPSVVEVDGVMQQAMAKFLPA